MDPRDFNNLDADTKFAYIMFMIDNDNKRQAEYTRLKKIELDDDAKRIEKARRKAVRQAVRFNQKLIAGI